MATFRVNNTHSLRTPLSHVFVFFFLPIATSIEVTISKHISAWRRERIIVITQQNSSVYL